MYKSRIWFCISIAVALITTACEKDLSYIIDQQMPLSPSSAANNWTQPVRDGITKPSNHIAANCTITDDVANLYQADAYAIARQLMAGESNAVVIPTAYYHEAQRLLAAVYNATNLPARDSVVAQFPIHDYAAQLPSEFLLSADASQTWVQNLLSGNLPTNNSLIDELMSQQLLTVSYVPFLGAFTGTVSPNVNLDNLLAQLNVSSGVSYTEINAIMGDGNRISLSKNVGYTDLTYSYGFGDCYAGCIGRWYWSFRVYPDCSVQHLHSWGTPIE